MSDPSVAYLVRHPNFYNSEGNTCIIVRNEVVFKVYKGLLAQQSPVFRNLFAERDAEACCRWSTYDEAPAIHVDDDPSDLAVLFTHLWTASTANDPSPGVTFTLLRMSHKYEIEVVRTWCINRLDTFIPATEEGFLSAQDWYEANPSYAIEVFRVSQACNLQQYLFGAYYWLSVSRTPYLPNDSSPYFGYEELRRVVSAKDFIVLWYNTCLETITIFEITQAKGQGPHLCETPGRCMVVGTAPRLQRFQFATSNPLVYLAKAQPPEDLCAVCSAVYKHVCRSLWGRTIKALETIFGLANLSGSS